jgi:hypothetical protein
MSFVAVAIGTGVAGLAGAAIQGNAAQNAANTQAQAATSSNQLQWTEFQQQQANMQPWLVSGQQNLAALNAQMPNLTRNFTMADFQQDPGYQFDLQQGQQAMQRSAAAQGMLNSTGTLQDLNNYAQGMASNEYGNAYNRFRQGQQQTYNMYSGMAGSGQNAAAGMGAMAMQNAGIMGQNTMAGANAASAGQVAQGNTFSNMLNTGANTYGNGVIMNKLFGGGGGMPIPQYDMGASMMEPGGGVNYAGDDMGANFNPVSEMT